MSGWVLAEVPYSAESKSGAADQVKYLASDIIALHVLLGRLRAKSQYLWEP